MLFAGGYDLAERSAVALVDLHKMDEGGLDVATMAAYLKQEARDEASLLQATEKAWLLLDGIRQRVECSGGSAVICTTPQLVAEAKKQGKKIIMPAIENGYAIGADLANIEKFRDAGVVYMTLCHNGDNDICDSARGAGEHGGLSPFGREVVREMNRVGMMIDLSHASEKSFYDVLEYSKVPVICSHSSSRTLCDHPRNLTDGQMKALANKGGVAQVCMYSGFLKKGGQATVDDAVKHIMYMIDVMGIDHVGIGSDFDGGGGLPGLEDASWFNMLTRRLISEGLSSDHLKKIWGENFVTVWSKIRAEKQ
jgi:microsomal dipeptidase-like Zn-dependent dipeptidase